MANSAGPRCRRFHFPFSEIERAVGSTVGSIIAVTITTHSPTERRKVGAHPGPDVPWW